MRKILTSKFGLATACILWMNQVFCQTNTAVSVLNEGQWYKVRIPNTGLYKISFEFLESMGYPTSNLPSNEVRLFGNSTGMLPIRNDQPRPDDLVENHIAIYDGGDGTFGPGDYLLFYAMGPDTWKYNAQDQSFQHTKHVFDDYSYYFVTRRSGAPKRVLTAEGLPDTAQTEIVKFPDYAFYELEKENIAKSGRRNYGEKFDLTDQYSFRFDFSNVLSNEPAFLRTHVACRSQPNKSTMRITREGALITDIEFSPVTSIYTVAFDATRRSPFVAGNANVFTYKFLKGGPGAVAWLDYVEVNLWRALRLDGNALRFRNYSTAPNRQHRYVISNASAGTAVWDVTEPTAPKQVSGQVAGDQLRFVALANNPAEYIAFRGSDFPAPERVGQVPNQNLHGLDDIDMVIVVHPDFRTQADRLADFHRSEGLTVEVVEPRVIYNEFSSGAVDVTAIKDFMKMLYNRGNATDLHHLRYLLLFGDGSYFNRDYQGNTNFILTHQSQDSEGLIESFVTDDYFGFLDPNESELPSDNVDIGIGRFPVSTPEQAKNVVDKILHYASTGYGVDEKSPFGDWRNKILFVADDLSGNPGSRNESGHMEEADFMARKLEAQQPNFLVDKIYLDAYKQITTPGGERYPEAATAFKNKVQQGVLMVNYTGHGGEVGLAHERILDLSTVNGWTNKNALPLFITATCEFSRFDDPDRTSAGEFVLLNPNGGGIALLSTTRVVFSSPNFTLNNIFYDYALPDLEGGTLRLGDITRLTKRDVANSSTSFHNHMNFTLLGDPALRLAYPKHRVITSTVNGKSVSEPMDTLRAYDFVTLGGEVVNSQNQKLTNFNGLVEVTVFDKAESLRTLGNDNPIYKEFTLKNRIIFKGKATVSNGAFTITFPIPKDINFSFGKASVMYYAFDGLVDANGGFNELVVGGLGTASSADNNGPDLELYMNNTDFRSGDATDANPNLLAFVRDPSGINTTGNGIGHELLAVLDENTENAMVLNDFYSGDVDTYQSGTVFYPLSGLSEGRHTLSMKVWDVYNNSSTSRVEFVVVSGDKIHLDQLVTYPNPFSSETTFSFQHNQAEKGLDLTLEIYDMMGKRIKVMQQTVNEPGYRSGTLKWDATTDSGHTINSGIYVYKLTLSQMGKTPVTQTGRLVYTK
ncbi:MAG TPA: type IX secretion system sortase PorU [Luteibaculaceae bacterium]|nr:type IX secretion system sortase PorU [Luteibaculaceae bacterium]